jgi:hypothetical protein
MILMKRGVNGKDNEMNAPNEKEHQVKRIYLN